MKRLLTLLLLLAPSVLAQNPTSGGPIPQTTYQTLPNNLGVPNGTTVSGSDIKFPGNVMGNSLASPNGTLADILPFGVDSGGVTNAYIVNTSPAVPALAVGVGITFTTTRTNTGASTINVSGLGAKPILYLTGAALSGSEIATGTFYQIVYDGVSSWILIGGNKTNVWNFAASPSGIPFSAAVVGGPAALTLLSNPLTGTDLNRNMLNFVCVYAGANGCGNPGNSNISFGLDGDNILIVSGSTGTQTAFLMPVNFYSPLGSGTSIAIINRTGVGGFGNDLIIDPGSPKSFGTAICIANGSNGLCTTPIYAVDSVGGYVTSGNKRFVATDFTDSTSGTLVAITGLSWVFPDLKARNFSFHCSLLFDQATAAVVDSFGIGSTVGPTNISAGGVSFSGVLGSPTVGTLIGLTTTTPTSIVSFTPSAITTVWTATLDGTIEMASANPGGTVSIYVSTTTGADNLIVKRGSYCSLF